MTSDAALAHKLIAAINVNLAKGFVYRRKDGTTLDHTCVILRALIEDGEVVVEAPINDKKEEVTL